MKKVFITGVFLLFFVYVFAQTKESIVVMKTWNTATLEKLLANQLIRVKTDSVIYSLKYDENAGKTMTYLKNNNRLNMFGGIPSYSPWDTTVTSIIPKDDTKYVSIPKTGVMIGVADSILRPDYADGGKLKMQANLDCIANNDNLAAAFAYLPASDTTKIGTANVYYRIKGTFTTSPLINFTVVATPGIRYDALTTQNFLIHWNTTVSSTHANCTIRCGVKKTGTLVASSIMSTYAKNAGELYTFSGVCVVSLSTNDEIQLVITADNAGDIITVHNYTTAIKVF